MTTTEHPPTAAGSGASASQVFRATHSATDIADGVSAERVDDVARALPCMPCMP